MKINQIRHEKEKNAVINSFLGIEWVGKQWHLLSNYPNEEKNIEKSNFSVTNETKQLFEKIK